MSSTTTAADISQLGEGLHLMSTAAADITDALEKWRAEVYPEHQRKMSISYLFSDQWQDSVNKLWEGYSELESRRRKVVGAARLSWQDEYEADNEQWLASRRGMFKPYPERLWHICPLWVYLARYQGRPEHEDNRRLYGWTSLLGDWEEMSELMEKDKNFRNAMSPTQQQSYRLLRLWWAATYCDRELVDAMRNYIESQRSVPTLDWYTLSVEKFASIARDIQTDKSKYHGKLFLLLLREFHPPSWEPNVWRVYLINLQIARYEAARMATMQQMAYAVLYPTTATRQVAYPVVVKNEHIGLRRAWAQTCDNPYYLWDSKHDKTVVVEDLARCPDYVCISHTWGRWNTRTKADVPGVPWPVPENRIFDVKSLPGQLHQLGRRYIWIDLFCIPQARSLRSRKEIANQASIFKGSSGCIAWINDVNSWDGVLKALDWISLKVWAVISAGGKELVKDRLLEATRSASVPMELMKTKRLAQGSPAADNLVGPIEPANWFSSLWTLQECALCPDIELYTSSWERLQDRCGTPIPLRALMFLCFESQHMLTNPTDDSKNRWYSDGMKDAKASAQSLVFPTAVQDIYNLSDLTRLEEVLTDASPIPVLVHSNNRRSTSSRAPAIMSAIGVTDWYLRSIHNKTKEPLLFNQYPISFVREAATKLGAQFYNCHGRLQRPSKVSKLFPVTMRAEFEGSMLPFSNSEGWFNNVNVLYNPAFVDKTDHEAVSTWTINEDASVTMRSAGVSMTSHDEPAAQKVAGLVIGIPQLGAGKEARSFGQTHGTEDMLASLKSISYGSRCIYAVALYEDSCLLHGVLLEHLPISMFSKQYLVKIGMFLMKETSLPPTRNVHWEVI
ncbi:hypothetical protein J3458_015479 [Metarhizium acridum]|uniref:uncharacterized protein n=1 Tax=Metarhizium acridum TaxID=92637 RepID=UPI001C6CE69E|nr:hypothetical protein J3458_015479 [Metarhizium acridum]